MKRRLSQAVLLFLLTRPCETNEIPFRTDGLVPKVTSQSPSDDRSILAVAVDPDLTLSRRERERLARRDAMLDAALEVFAEKGYNSASVDEIAERAEFGKGTIYNYFPDGKDELFLTLFKERVAAGMHRVISASFEDADLSTPATARAAFQGFIRGLIEQFDDTRGPMLMFMREGHRTKISIEHEAAFALHFYGIIEAVANAIGRAVESGALRPLPAHPVAHVLMGNVRGYLMAELDADCDPTGTFKPAPFGSSHEAAEFLTTVLFDGLLAQTDGPTSTDS
jgi:AcrR family transcriptional regulator